MNSPSTTSISTRIVQVCLFLAAAIAIFGGSVQMYLGEPDVSPRLDNIHRFMAGLYLSMGIICFWAAYTIQTQKTLVYLISLAILIAAVGRLISMSVVGLPEPHGLWITYLSLELVLPVLMVLGQLRRK